MTKIKMRNISIVLCLLLLFSISVKGQNDNDSKKKSITDGSELLGRVNLDIGFNILRDAPAIMGINTFQSKSAGLYYMMEYPLGKKITFNPSLGVTMEKYSFDQNVVLDYFDDGSGSALSLIPQVSASSDTLSLKRSKLATSYLEAPIEFRFYLKGHENNEGIYFGLGAFGGIRLESHTKRKFDEDGIKKLEKKRGDFQQRSIRYGVHGRIGFKGVSLFYKHSFSNIFNSQGPVGSGATRYSTIGFTISGL